jgi:hypothetical protein
MQELKSVMKQYMLNHALFKTGCNKGDKTLVKTIPTHALFIKTLIVLKNQALHMFRPANWPSSGATSVPQHNHVQ